MDDRRRFKFKIDDEKFEVFAKDDFKNWDVKLVTRKQLFSILLKESKNI